jgi:hypothetical protein
VLDLKTNLTQTIRGNTGNRANNNLRLLEKLFQMPFIKVEDVDNNCFYWSQKMLTYKVMA